MEPKKKAEKKGTNNT